MNNDDFDESSSGPDDAGGFDEFSQKNTLGDLWRNSPLVKVGVVVGAAAIIFGAILLFGGETEESAPSVVPAGADVTSVPGGDKASPAYVQAVEEQNQENLERALRTQESNIPVPVDHQATRLELPQEEGEAEDPLHRWRRLQEERVEREIKEREEAEPVTVLDSEQKNEAMQKLAEAMSKQMESVLGSNEGEKTFGYMAVTDPVAFAEDRKADVAEDELSLVDGTDDTSSVELPPEIIIPAGEIEYAQLITEANSDVPGPVLATLASGPLSGSKLLGTFEVQDEEYITLNFDTIVVKDQSYAISAIALDPNTTLSGMATEVDHRYFRRVVLPAAAAFVEGFSGAIAESGTTTITISGETVAAAEEDKDSEQEVASGIEEMGQELGEIIDNEANRTQVLVKIHSGTPVGILFLEPVIEEAAVQ